MSLGEKPFNQLQGLRFVNTGGVGGMDGMGMDKIMRDGGQLFRARDSRPDGKFPENLPAVTGDDGAPAFQRAGNTVVRFSHRRRPKNDFQAPHSFSS